IAVFAVVDALFTPLVARQEVLAREAGLQTARNDSLLAVAEAYFNVQQARGELAGLANAPARAGEGIRKAEERGPGGLAPRVERAGGGGRGRAGAGRASRGPAGAGALPAPS